MQHVGQRNNIEAPVPDRIELVDFVAVKHKIKIVEVKHIAGDNVREKLFQRRRAASYLEYGKRCRIGKTLELITVKFAVPKEKVLIRTEARAITQCDGTILSLVASSNCGRPHLTARI